MLGKFLCDQLGILAQDFNEMAARLRSQIASKEILLRDISHELRSPLTRLRVALSLAQRGDGNIGTQLERIERDIERLDTLIGQTLQLSRLSSGGPTLAREDIDLGELVNEVVDDAQFEASAAIQGKADGRQHRECCSERQRQQHGDPQCGRALGRNHGRQHADPRSEQAANKLARRAPGENQRERQADGWHARPFRLEQEG
jgi:signal transduction histidine kinase